MSSPVSFFGILQHLTGRNLLLPFYHAVSDNNLPHIKHLYRVKSVRDFEKELDFMLKHYTPVDVTEVNTLSKSKKAVLLSFDDGLAEMYHVVFPLLQRKGVPAIFFLNSAFVDNAGLFYRYKASLLADILHTKPETIYKEFSDIVSQPLASNGELSKCILNISYSQKEVLEPIAHKLDVDFTDFLLTQKPYLTKTQITEMVNAGFHFGAHSIDHPVFAHITECEQLRQVTESIAFVQQYFGDEHLYFSFPFFDTHVKKSFFEALKEMETKNKPKLLFGSSGLKTDEIPNVYQRLSMDKVTKSGIQFLYTQHLKYLAKMILGKTTYKHPL